MDLASCQWLVSEAAVPWLAAAGNIEDRDLVRFVSRLRRELSASQVQAIVGQRQLRARAQTKFAQANQLFFTERALQQATSSAIARYKANRFPEQALLADLCCGIGGDLMALAKRGPVEGVELDPRVATLARANLRQLGVSASVTCGRAEAFPVESVHAWHIDPDRRTDGRRSVQLEHHAPGANVLSALLQANPHAAIKLAPATNPHDPLLKNAECEWLGTTRECKQMVAWFGQLSQQSGRHVATIVGEDGQCLRQIIDNIHMYPISSREETEPGRYVYEPCAVILAANLGRHLAAEFGLHRILAGIEYYTHDTLRHDIAWQVYQIEEVLPFDEKILRQALRVRGVGRLTIKSRGLGIDLPQLRKGLRTRGDREAILLIARNESRALALLATDVARRSPS